jgi:hypothetical protein
VAGGEEKFLKQPEVAVLVGEREVCQELRAILERQNRGGLGRICAGSQASDGISAAAASQLRMPPFEALGFGHC